MAVCTFIFRLVVFYFAFQEYLTTADDQYFSGSQNMPSPQEVEQYVDFLEQVVQCKKVTSGSITLVKNNKVILSRGFGYANPEEKKAATNETKFCIGSLTKAFTTSVIAKVLSQHASLTWDTPIKDILGSDFRLSDSLRTEQTNLRDLLAHKLGIPSNFMALLVGFPENTTREEFIRKIGYQKPIAPFRTRFLYSNYMYTLAAYVAERITGRTWEDMVREDFLRPLQMGDSGFVNEVKDFHDFSPSFSFFNGTPVPNEFYLLYAVDSAGPAGSIYTTSNDMVKWIKFHLNNGKISQKELVPEKFWKETQTGQMTTPFNSMSIFRPKFPINDATVSYNMGWITSFYRGYKKIWHSGGIVNYSSMLWLFPDMNAGLFITLTGSVGNRNRDPIYVLASRAADLLIGEEPWLNHTTACSYPEPWGTSSPVQLGDRTIPPPYWNISNNPSYYEGLFHNRAFGNITIQFEKESLLMLYFGRFGIFRLYPITNFQFRLYFEGALSYMTSSDDNTKAANVTFTITDDVRSLTFPFSTYNTVVFEKIDQQVAQFTITTSDVNAVSATSLPGGLTFVMCNVIYILCFIFYK